MTLNLSFNPSDPVERTTVQAIIDLLEDQAVETGPVNTAPMAEALKRRRGRKAAPLVSDPPKDTTTTVGVNAPLPANPANPANPALAEHLQGAGKEPEEITIPKSTSASTDTGPQQQDLATILVDPVKVVDPKPVTVTVGTGGVNPPAPVSPTSKPKTIEDVREAYRAMHDIIGSDMANKLLLGALAHHSAANLSSLAADKYQELITRFAQEVAKHNAAAGGTAPAADAALA